MDAVGCRLYPERIRLSVLRAPARLFHSASPSAFAPVEIDSVRALIAI